MFDNVEYWTVDDCVYIQFEQFPDLWFKYDDIQMSEESNEDGTYNMSFNITFFNPEKEQEASDEFVEMVKMFLNVMIEETVQRVNNEQQLSEPLTPTE